jgi:NUMOD3 motif
MHFVYYLLEPTTGQLLYIGCSTDPKSRVNAHRIRLKRPLILSPLMQRFRDRGLACAAELAAIVRHAPPLNKVLHSGPGSLGIKHSAEFCKKVSQACKGRRVSDELKLQLSVLRLGRKHTEEAKANMSAAQLALKKRYGPETKAKIAAVHLGRKQSREWIENAAATRRGKKRSDETKVKTSQALKGKPFTAERIENIRKAQKARREREQLLKEMP